MNSGRIILINTPEHTNIGDHLIALAEYVFFKEYVPSYQVVEITGKNYRKNLESIKRNIKKEDIIVVTGGGFLGSLWQSGENVLDIVKRFQENKIIIFPQSIYFEENERGVVLKKKLLEIFCAHPKLYVCYREKFSFDLGTRLFRGKVKQFLVPDMALILDKRQEANIKRGILLCLRDDKESILSTEDKKKIRQSLIASGYVVEETSMHWITDFNYENRSEYVEKKIKQLQAYRLVVTDTLHCMISCYISGVLCIALNNLTKKVEGVYEYCLSNAPYIYFCRNKNGFFDYFELAMKSNQNYTCYRNIYKSDYMILAQLITGECELLVDTAIIKEEKLYFTAVNTPGVIYIYQILDKKIENMFVYPFSRAIICSYKNELWLIPKKSKKIVICNIEDMEIIDTLPLEFIEDKVFDVPKSSIFVKPIQEENILWLSCVIGLIKIDMEKRNYKVYRYSDAGFEPYNLAYTIQKENSIIYMFGEHCFIFDSVKENMELWMSGKRLLFGLVDSKQVISVPTEGNDKYLHITDLYGKNINLKEISTWTLSEKAGGYIYWWTVRHGNLCFFLPYKAKNIILYNLENKKFSKWDCSIPLSDVLKLKKGFLFIQNIGNCILYYNEEENILDKHFLKISFQELYELSHKYSHLTISCEQSENEIEEWAYGLKSTLLGTWADGENNKNCNCANEIWENMKSYLGGK